MRRDVSQVLVDTSAWIEFFQAPRSLCGQAVDVLLGEGRICTTPLVMVEVISRARDQAAFERLRTDFRALSRLEPPADLWDTMLDARWRCKLRGITGLSIPDLIIAITARAHRVPILTRDHDFRRMQPVLDLQLVEVSH